MTITIQPGLLTCNQSHNREALKNDGYRWQSYQAWNAGRRGPSDTGGDYRLEDDRAYGISPGVWGIAYSTGEFYSAGKGTAERAVELGADHLMMDIEECLKGTFATQDGMRVVNGVRDGGWFGPIHLTTLGAPEQKPEGGFYDYEMDLASFLATGGGIFPQAYYADTYTQSGRAPTLAAELCVAYFCDQIGVPRQQLNLMVWPNGFNPIDEEIDHLQAAGLGCQFSVFLTESTSGPSFDALTAITGLPPWTAGNGGEVVPPDPPPDELEPIGSQHGITASINRWREIDPGGTNPNRDPANTSTWGAYDKLERTLNKLREKYDQEAAS